MRARLVLAGLFVVGCAPPEEDLNDDADRYLDDVDYRRGILERDLLSVDNHYAQARLANYGLEGRGWELLAERDAPTLPLTVDMALALAAGDPLTFDAESATSLVPDELPDDSDAWATLGRRTLMEYPMYVDPDLSIAATEGWLDELGFLQVDGVYNGIRVLMDDGAPALGLTCSACHASTAATGDLNAILANREFDLGRLRLVRILEADAQLPPLAEYDESIGHLATLGRGRSDPLNDGIPNPYAFPDLGGIADLPYLHHTANWHNRGIATLAIRVETVFVADEVDGTRVPRALAWALAEYLYSLPPPPPLLDARDPVVERGREVFEEQPCAGCHVPPLFTSDRLVSLEEIGTDPAAGQSPSRRTGYYRIPSLRGVGRTAPYLHHGAFASLEDMFDPTRQGPGHPFGLTLSATDRTALIRFLRSI